ncbi:Serine/threonine-protein kinase 19 [Actinomortierella ambigua]|uniref:Serine/threonine-protein kinase 19 n=1 Tax=Actinomortierella ambigua TaxID=1343610 RepID=A0A9P6QCM4_9FUNG|nr:Serine/threonine-protein kinase 19 [Actinomortierella ambigua]
MNSRHSHTAAAPVATCSIPDLADDLDPSQLPTDTQAAMEYLLAQLHPRRIKDRKIFPKVCMVHQIYGIVKDHTTVDRTVDQLVKNGTLRKFFLGGTGSDEFAIMFTADYVQQIEDAKAQYLKDLSADSARSTTTLPGSKRKMALDTAASQGSVADPRTTKARKTVNGGKSAASTTTDMIENELLRASDRFKMLVTGGKHLEVMIQHLTLQHVMDVSDADITLLIRYGLLNRMLTVPANPHLVNMTRTSSRGAGSGSSSASGGGDSGSTAASEAQASSLRAAHQTIATLRAQGRASSSSSVASSTTPSSSSPSSSSPSSSSTLQFSKEGISVQAAGSRGEQVSDEIFYRFAIRQGGLFVSHFLKGRQEMLRSIKRKPFGDMLVSAIKAKTLRGSMWIQPVDNF